MRVKVVGTFLGFTSLGYVSTIDSNRRTIFVTDAHRGDGKRFVVSADEKLTAFLELESAIRGCGEFEVRGFLETGRWPRPPANSARRPIQGFYFGRFSTVYSTVGQNFRCKTTQFHVRRMQMLISRKTWRPRRCASR